MNARPLAAAGLAAGLISVLASGSLAQPRAGAAPARAPAPAPAPATPQVPVSQGPPIPGLCVFSQREILAESKVGQAVAARLKVLGQQVSAELQPEADAINTEARGIETQRATMDQATYQAREANLQLRYSNLQKRGQQRDQEMQATQQKQVGVILKEAEPILRTLYQQKSCSILIEADAGGVMVLSPAMNLSGQVITGLDAKIQTLTFDREHLETQQGAAGAPAS